ncbi:unnamed protein product [Cunninghamella blakesleeana]
MKFTLVIAALFATAAIAAPCGKRHPSEEVKTPEISDNQNNGQVIGQNGVIDKSETDNSSANANGGIVNAALNKVVDINKVNALNNLNVLGTTTVTQTEENKIQQKAKQTQNN